jgi:hypothetical protein
MARKRKTKVVYRYKKRKSSKKQAGFNFGSLAKPIGGVAYGFVRDRISDAIARSSIGQKLPVSNFTDEGVMLAVMYLTRKMGGARNKIVGSLVRNGESVEWARIGETLSDMHQNKITGSPTGATGLVIVG